MEEILDRSTARTSFTLGLLELASLAALLIGAVGLYGVVSYMVKLRARELAIRMALGADPGAVRRQIMRQAVAVAGLGIVLGLGATLPLTRGLSALLFDVAPTDGTTLALAVVLLAAVAVLASWLPARRAAGIDVASVLREDG
jgi:ABC-type antimicrobial peptide transport system permease subunit